MAQLVAHHTGSVGVRGSSPLSSTPMNPQVDFDDLGFFVAHYGRVATHRAHGAAPSPEVTYPNGTLRLAFETAADQPTGHAAGSCSLV